MTPCTAKRHQADQEQHPEHPPPETGDQVLAALEALAHTEPFQHYHLPHEGVDHREVNARDTTQAGSDEDEYANEEGSHQQREEPAHRERERRAH